MPHAADNPPTPQESEKPAGAEPAPQAAAGLAAEAQPGAPPGQQGGPLPGAPPTGDQPRRRRRRRRRRGPRPSGAEGAAAPGQDGPAQAQSANPVSGPTGPPADTPPLAEAAAGHETVPGAAPTGDQPRRRRRRRRRRGPRPEGAAPAEVKSEGQSAPGAEAQPPPGGEARTEALPDAALRDRGPRHRGPRDGRSRDERQRDRAPRDGASRDRGPREGAPRDHGPRDGASRDRGPRDGAPRDPAARHQGARDKGPRGFKDRPFGKGRDSFGKKPEPKLYSFESVVDRGFEDVVDEAAEGATRRVEWTIVKRTTADQRSAKPVSAVYVLRRDGANTEFAQLAAARAVVHKTIVHPEKLTRPKADYPAGKK
jgi:hypothetical protein